MSLTLISLIGLPGCGKSTIGRHLARHLGRAFVDSDVEIERRIGCSIKEFFEREGEGPFRDLEQRVIEELVARPDTVLATGGGTVLRAANRATLRNSTTAMYLRSTPEELYRRLRHDTQRPLLQVRDPLRKLRDLFAEREPYYRETAHFVIETGRPSIATLVNMILMQLELAGLVDPARARSTAERRPYTRRDEPAAPPSDADRRDRPR